MKTVEISKNSNKTQKIHWFTRQIGYKTHQNWILESTDFVLKRHFFPNSSLIQHFTMALYDELLKKISKAVSFYGISIVPVFWLFCAVWAKKTCFFDFFFVVFLKYFLSARDRFRFFRCHTFDFFFYKHFCCLLSP